MTNTSIPSANDSGLNLDHLEALARAATAGPWAWFTSNSTLRLTGADGRDGGVLYGYVHSGWGDVNCAPNDQAFIVAANPYAVLELIALARRAKPEGEAPQAELVELLKAIRPNYGDVGSRDTDVTAQRKRIDRAIELLSDHAATLPPLCGAQHAESGKEANKVIVADAGELRAELERAKRALVRAGFQDLGGAEWKPPLGKPPRFVTVGAQQAAAPMSAKEFFAEARRLGCALPRRFCEELAAAPDYSAPGTPEAPADLPRLYRFDCYVGKTKMAAGVGVHASTMEEAEQKARKMIDKEETIKFESNQPCHATRKCGICAAYERAAQLDGGQEGSGS